MRSPFLARLATVATSPQIAIEDDFVSRSFTEIYARALHVREALCDCAPSLEGRRIALLSAPGVAWVEAFLGISLAGGVALPLSPLYPPAELGWFAADAEADTVILSPEPSSRAHELVQGRRLLTTEALSPATQ